MQKFVNLTQSQNEKAIKIGNKVPDNAIGLSWFKTKNISPVNNIVKIDLSETIQENFTSFTQQNENSFIALADELGFLKTIDGKYTFSSNDISVSNVFLSSPTENRSYDPSSLNAVDFIHSYYVSRFFIVAPQVFSFYSLKQFVEHDVFKYLNMRVVDKNGIEYIDPNTERRKYRFLLESFKTETNYLRTEIPHRIVVVFDAAPADGLQLLYDKVEADENGNTFNLQINYTETINTVKYFEEIPEEAFVIDDNYRNDRKFSIKKISQKYSNLLVNQNMENGYQVVVPSKALDDYRTYEVFNWRLIARSNTPINISEIQTINESGVDRTKIKAGVLHTTEDIVNSASSKIPSYLFYRLQNSPFNLIGYTFYNPYTKFYIETPGNTLIEPGIGDQFGATDLFEQYARYWHVNIDDTLIPSLGDYDILAWRPTAKITLNQSLKIKNFLRQNGTLILDLSLCPDATALDININHNPIIATYEDTNTDSVIIDYTKNGGWTIVPGMASVGGIFEKEYYGVYGSRKKNHDGSYKSYKTFANYSTANSFIDISPITTQSYSIGLVLPYINEATELVRSNIVAVTFPLFEYCNSIYSVGEDDLIINNNNNPTYEALDGNIYSSVLEGPMKLLYNIIAYTSYCRTQATREVRTESSLFNFVTDWSSGWVLNDTVMLDDEKQRYFKNIPNVDRFGLDLIPNHRSISDFYKQSVLDFLPSYQKDRIFGADTNNIDFYIEITNPDVTISDAEKVDFSALVIDENIPSSYNLFKLANSSAKPYAYTDKYSPSLSVPDNFGAYTIVEKPYNSSDSVNLIDNLNIFNALKAYPIDISRRTSFAVGQDKPKAFNAGVDLGFDVIIKGKMTRPINVTVPPSATPVLNEVDAVLDCENFFSAIDDLNVRTYSSKTTFNTYLYSGDIDIHKDYRLWKAGMSHQYVKYIQYTVGAATGLKVAVDGKYGTQTANAVRTFQIKGNQRYIDGTVDSETKSYMAFWWKNVKKYYSTLYQNLKNSAPQDVLKYIVAVENAGVAQDIGFKTYKKLTFSGFAGPAQAKDFIFFKVPTKVTKINKIVIEADSNAVWRNFYIDIYGYSSVDYKDIMKTTNFEVYKTPQNGKIELILNNINANNARYMWFQIRGKSLNGYGFAEGFSIKSIKVYGKVLEEPKNDGATISYTTEDIWALASFSATDIFNNIDYNNTVIKNYNSNNFLSLARQNASAGSLKLTSLKLGVNADGTETGGSPFADGKPYSVPITNFVLLDSELRSTYIEQNLAQKSIALDFTILPSKIRIKSASLNYVKSENGDPANISDISMSYTSSYGSSSLSLSTSAGIYTSNGLSFNSAEKISNFYLKTLDGYIYPSNIKTVDSSNGILLLCDATGASVGITSEIIRILNSVKQSSISDEIDFREVAIGLENNSSSDDGFVYGFYDISQRQFIGKVVNYIEIIQRGSSNIFIAVCATDIDGNTQSKNDFIGPKTSMKFKPVSIPLKTICPIYSVKINKSTVIKVGDLNSELSKFNIWELPVSNGSFWKEVLISQTKSWTDWKSKYLGKTLRAFYSTMDEDGSSWSKIYGHGYYDIVDEYPLVIDDRTIKLRRYPLMSYWYPTDNADTSAGLIKQELHIFIRQDLESEWSEISHSAIRDIESQTGLIKFKNRLIPNNPNLIKVTYVTRSKDKMLRHVNGKPIPLNPVLNIDDIDFDQALYIYLLPKAIFNRKFDVSVPSNANVPINPLEVIDDYNYQSAINFTYDSSIFNEKSAKYNPFALPIAIIYVTNNPYKQEPELYDIRVRGGGVTSDKNNSELINLIPNVLSYWDVYPPSGSAYAKGGYVIIRIPEQVKNYFTNEKEIMNIIANNLTAGIAFDVQDMTGKNWT